MCGGIEGVSEGNDAPTRRSQTRASPPSKLPLSAPQPEYWPTGIGGYDLSSGKFTPGWPAFDAYYNAVARRLVKINAGYQIWGLSWCARRAGWTRLSP